MNKWRKYSYWDKKKSVGFSFLSLTNAEESSIGIFHSSEFVGLLACATKTPSWLHQHLAHIACIPMLMSHIECAKRLAGLTIEIKYNVLRSCRSANRQTEFSTRFLTLANVDGAWCNTARCCLCHFFQQIRKRRICCTEESQTKQNSVPKNIRNSA